MMNRRFDLSALVRLQKQRRNAAAGMARQPQGDGALVEVTGFGSDPGGLRMLTHVPQGLAPGAALVVALHGCTQTAAGYDQGCGWSAMSDRLGFALLMPEQRRANNAQLCFNWFEAGDAVRDAGEAQSIRQMVAQMVRTHGLDPKRVFVTGLSAGGAMTSVMLATYPEVFAGGAIIAGLPYAGGIGVAEALRTMSRPSALTPALRGGAVRAASAHAGPWPRVAVWHGDADATVAPDNAEESVKQWLDLHGLAGAKPDTDRRSGGHAEQAWLGDGGVPRVALHRIAGMGHGVPLRPGEGEGQSGAAGAYMLDVGVSSTHSILEFWGLEGGASTGAQAARQAGRPASADAARPAAAGLGRAAAAAGATAGIVPNGLVIDVQAEAAPEKEPVAVARPFEAEAGPEAAADKPWPAFPFADPGAVITRALRAAGLMGNGRE